MCTVDLVGTSLVSLARGDLILCLMIPCQLLLTLPWFGSRLQRTQHCMSTIFQVNTPHLHPSFISIAWYPCVAFLRRISFILCIVMEGEIQECYQIFIPAIINWGLWVPTISAYTWSLHPLSNSYIAYLPMCNVSYLQEGEGFKSKCNHCRR